MPVVLIVTASIANVILLRYFDQRSQSSFFDSNFFGFTEVVSANGGAIEATSLDGDATAEMSDVVNAVAQQSALVNSNNPLSNAFPTREGLMLYKIQKGDTVSKIAVNFGVTPNTILWANPKLKNGSLSVGQEVTILPTDGVLHQVQSGETLESIAALYAVEVQRVAAFNRSAVSGLVSGTTLVIPGGKPLQVSRLASSGNLPEYPGYFAIPTTGWNWGRLHNYNAVDIANACGTPVYAAAEGLVVEASDSGWNGGYGHYLIIEHPNGTKTRYAHNDRHLVSVGDYVLKGDQVATIGNTGNTHGPTGCHLHFEVIGAKNPFAK